MKNVTISLPEDVAQWARIWAAKHNTSVSRMLGVFLQQKMDNEKMYQQAKQAFHGKDPKVLKKRTETYPDRDSLYER